MLYVAFVESRRARSPEVSFARPSCFFENLERRQVQMGRVPTAPLPLLPSVLPGVLCALLDPLSPSLL